MPNDAEEVLKYPVLEIMPLPAIPNIHTSGRFMSYLKDLIEENSQMRCTRTKDT